MRIGHLLGAEVRVDPLMAALGAIAVTLGYLPEVAIFAAVLVLHELGHLVAAAAEETPVEAVTLHPFGGVARVRGLEFMGVARAVPVALAGPVVNLVLAGLGLAAMRHGPAALASAPRLGLWLDLNLAMAAVNLLPVLPLDGGQALFSVLAARGGIGPSAHLLARIGMVLGATLAALGAGSLAFGGRLVDVGLFGAFLALAARREDRQAPYARAVAHERKRSRLAGGALVEGRLVVASSAVPLGVAWRALAPRPFHVLRVVDAQARALGEIDETALYDALVRLGPAASLGEAAGWPDQPT